MLDWCHFGGVYGGRKDRYRVAELSQLSLVDVEIAICSVALYISYRENGSGHIERADCRCGRPSSGLETKRWSAPHCLDAGWIKWTEHKSAKCRVMSGFQRPKPRGRVSLGSSEPLYCTGQLKRVYDPVEVQLCSRRSWESC
jgi:hypothetical protein